MQASRTDRLGDRLFGFLARHLGRAVFGTRRQAPSSRRYRSISCQFVPTLKSTSSAGVERQGALHHLASHLGEHGQLLGIGLEDELVVDLEQHPGAAGRARASRRRGWTIAILMPSAAVPWIGMLIAIRSPAERSALLRAVSSGR